MLNLGGIFGAIGRMLPGYVQGREQAISGNWQDLSNYNNVMSGQIHNAFDELTFPWAFNRYMDTSAISRANALQTLMNLGARTAGFPYELQTGWMRSQQGPGLYQDRITAARAESQRAAQNARDPMGGLGNLGFDLTGFTEKLNNTARGINPNTFANEGWMRGQNPMQQPQPQQQTAPLGTQTMPSAALGQGNGFLDGVTRPSPFGPK